MLIYVFFSTLSNPGDKVTITPISDACTYVNGNLITAETRLHHVGNSGSQSESVFKVKVKPFHLYQVNSPHVVVIFFIQSY